MAPLPSRDQRHLWLHYSIEGYTEEILDNFEKRLETIFDRQVNRVHILDFEGLTLKMRQDLAVRLRMVYTGGDGQLVFVSHGWRRLFRIRAPLVHEFILEFLSTCWMSDTEIGLNVADGQAPEKVIGVDLFYLRSIEGQSIRSNLIISAGTIWRILGFGIQLIDPFTVEKMDDPNITIEEYIRLEEEKAQRHSRTLNWQTATFGKVKYYEAKNDCFIDFETEFPAIVFDNTLTSDTTTSFESTVARYIEEIVHDFKQRLEMIFGKQVNRVHILDFEGLTPKMRQDLAVKLRMMFTGGDGQLVFVSHAWRRLFGIQAPLVRGFILEFLSTCRMSDAEIGLDVVDTLCFQLGGVKEDDMEATYSSVRYSGKGQAPEKATDIDLFYLRNIDRGTTNVPHLLAHDEGLRGLQVVARELPLIDLHELGRLNICSRFNDTWAWVAPKPERQQAATTGAHEGDEAGLELTRVLMIFGSRSLPRKSVDNLKGELKAITTRSSRVLDVPTVPTPTPFINPKVDERVEETLTDPDLAEYTIKVPPPPVQKYKPLSQREYVVHQRDPLYPNIPYPSRMLKQKQQEKDEVQIHKFWKMFKHLHINITLADALILMPKYQKMLKALMSNKEKLQELANTPLNENCSAVILKKLPEKLGDPGKFLILCGFSELKCKALADLGASINLMPLSVWKNLGLPELISTRMTLELTNRAICTPAGIARDVFVSVGKFTFPADFVIVDYESDLRVPLILGRPFLRTARALVDVHGEEMILCDGDERLTVNMRHDTSSYSNQPQKESINFINVFNNSSDDFLEDLFSNQPSGNPTFSSHPELTSPEVNDDIFDSEGGNVLPKKLLDLDSAKDLHPPLHVNQLSGNTTYSFSLNPLLEEFADELTLITFPPKYDDYPQFDIESDLKEIEFLLYQYIDSSLKDSIDQKNLANPADIFIDFVPEMFTDEHALDYSSLPIFDEYDDDFLEIESDTENVYDDPFDSKGEKIKESKLLNDKLDLPCDFLPSEYDSFISQDFRGLMLCPQPTTRTRYLTQDFDPPFYEPLFFKEVPKSKMLLPFSSENKEKVFKPGIHTSEKVHSFFIPKLSHQGYKIFKINQIFKSLMKNFLFSWGKNTHIFAFPCLHFYPLDQFKYGGNWVKLSDPEQALRGRHPMLILS
nr:reverse transcriptase domain-containing protein [Tanacetum cinerariifolium]